MSNSSEFISTEGRNLFSTYHFNITHLSLRRPYVIASPDLSGRSNLNSYAVIPAHAHHSHDKQALSASDGITDNPDVHRE
jgi:hypothetical protein